MLWLEILRILERPEDYEEAAVQFCIAFELSPPSWDAAPRNIRAMDAEPSAGADAPGGRIEWQGVIDGDGDRHFRRVEAASAATARVVIDCRELRRLAFSAASALLTLGRRLNAAGKTIELRNVNPLVAALLQLMGVVEFISVHLRRG
jgi:anti-anti-sigma regulatory factor